MILTKRLYEMWSAYEVASSRDTRDAKLAALGRFLDELTVQPIETWSEWACDLARRAVDNEESLQFPMPLFRRAIFPALLAGHNKGVPGCTRWLAGLSQHLYRCRECQAQLPPEEQTEIGLLHIALRNDPGDLHSRRRLLNAWAQQIAFCLHEIPLGVLYGMDGATSEQCTELQEWLEEFATLAGELHETAKYGQLIEDGRYHFREYREYLATRMDGDSYATFLASRGRCGDTS